MSFAEMLQALNADLPAITTLITAASYLIGFWFFFRGIYKLRQYGELRTMMASNTDLRDPMMLFAAGACLLFLPTIISIAESTFFSNYTATPISYGVLNAKTEWEMTERVVLALVRLVGLIAFIKSVMMLGNLNSHSGGQNTLGKALTHMIGGVMAMNINATIDMVRATFGFQ